MGEVEGMVKTVFDAKTGELLGAHMIGAEVTEMIQGYTIARTLEATEAELMDTVFPHPTISETMHEAVLDAYGRNAVGRFQNVGNEPEMPKPAMQ
jgi:dihydrolipoamide dehydrogenase